MTDRESQVQSAETYVIPFYDHQETQSDGHRRPLRLARASQWGHNELDPREHYKGVEMVCVLVTTGVQGVRYQTYSIVYWKW